MDESKEERGINGEKREKGGMDEEEEGGSKGRRIESG